MACVDDITRMAFLKLETISSQNADAIHIVDPSTLSHDCSIIGKGVQLIDGGQLLIGSDIVISNSPSVIVHGPGARVYIASGTSLDGTQITARGRNCFVYIGPMCRLRRVLVEAKGRRSFVAIGHGASWESGGCIASGDDFHILLGNDAMVSSNVMVRTQDGHGIFDADAKSLLNSGASVVIEPHVWLGNSSRVNKGTRIGTGTVLASTSLATKTLDQNCVYAGSPAKKVRTNIRWSRTYRWDDIPSQYT